MNTHRQCCLVGKGCTHLLAAQSTVALHKTRTASIVQPQCLPRQELQDGLATATSWTHAAHAMS